MGLKERIEEKIKALAHTRDIRVNYIRKLNNSISIGILLLIISTSLYFYLAYQTKLSAISSSIDIVKQAIVNQAPVNALASNFASFSNLFIAQLIVFLFATVTLVVIGRTLASKYNVVRNDSLSDALTKTYNKKAILFALRREILRTERYGHPTTIAILDIDFFKKFNDTNGHVEGDELLKRLAHVIKKAIREYDLFGRFGGEEFIVIFPETRMKEAYKICERMRVDIENEKFKGRQNMPKKEVTVSIGLSEIYGKRQSGERSVSTEKLLDKADELLYVAKDTGRNKVVFEK